MNAHVCACACVRACMCVHVHACALVWVCVHAYMRVNAYMWVSSHVTAGIVGCGFFSKRNDCFGVVFFTAGSFVVFSAELIPTWLVFRGVKLVAAVDSFSMAC